MFYYKLNLHIRFYLGGSKAVKFKILFHQWLEMLNQKNMLFGLDTFFQKNIQIYTILKWWMAFYLYAKTRRFRKKLLNFAHHYEFEQNGLKIKIIKKTYNEKE